MPVDAATGISRYVAIHIHWVIFSCSSYRKLQTSMGSWPYGNARGVLYRKCHLVTSILTANLKISRYQIRLILLMKTVLLNFLSLCTLTWIIKTCRQKRCSESCFVLEPLKRQSSQDTVTRAFLLLQRKRIPRTTFAGMRC